MPAPLAKGLIIAASVIVAAGIAIYESPQVRQWVDQSRRKIAVALNSLADDANQSRRASESLDEYQARRRRDEMIRKKRNALVQKAREDGVAVDLDELARIGSDNVDMAERTRTSDRTKSFDHLVGSDGKLRATGNDSSSNTLKKRGAVGFAAGSAAAAAMANPFSDDNVLFDVGDGENDEAPSPKPFAYVENDTRESSATITPETMSDLAPVLIANDATSPATPSTSVETPQAPATADNDNDDDEEEANTAAQSFYSMTSSPTGPLSTGTLTPRSHHSRTNSHSSSIHSLVSFPPDILSAQNDTDHDARSDAFSENGWTDAAVSESGDDRPGIMTPNSWTDVGSDDGSEWTGHHHA